MANGLVVVGCIGCICSEFNPKDGHLLAGGCYNGQVCWWDDRKGGKPEGEISLAVSHIEPVYKTMWIQSKTLSEFFTASTDGTVSSFSSSHISLSHPSIHPGHVVGHQKIHNAIGEISP